MHWNAPLEVGQQGTHFADATRILNVILEA
jgi:hypothetical protein